MRIVLTFLLVLLTGTLTVSPSLAAVMPFEDMNDNGVYDAGVDRALTSADVQLIAVQGFWSSFEHSLVIPQGASLSTNRNGWGLRLYAKKNITVHGSLTASGPYGNELTLDVDTGRIEIGPSAVLKGGGGMFITTRDGGMTVAPGAKLISGEAAHIETSGTLDLPADASGSGATISVRSGLFIDARKLNAVGTTIQNGHPRGISWISVGEPSVITHSTMTLKNGIEIFAREGLDFTSNRVVASARATIQVFVHLGTLDYTGSVFKPSAYPHLILSDSTGQLND